MRHSMGVDGAIWMAFLEANGARRRIRTADTVIFSHVLYQLSYPGIAFAAIHDGISVQWKRAFGEARWGWQAPRAAYP